MGNQSGRQTWPPQPTKLMLGGKWRDSKVKGGPHLLALRRTNLGCIENPNSNCLGKNMDQWPEWILKANSSKDTGSWWSPRLVIHWEQRGNHLTKPAIPSVTSSKIQPSSSMFSLIFFSISLWTKPYNPWCHDDFDLTKPTQHRPPGAQPWLELSQWCPTWRPRPEECVPNTRPNLNCNGHFLLSCAKIRVWLLNSRRKTLSSSVCFTSDMSPFRTFVIWCSAAKTACMASFLPWRVSGWHEHGQEKRLLQCWLMWAEHSNCEVNQ